VTGNVRVVPSAVGHTCNLVCLAALDEQPKHSACYSQLATFMHMEDPRIPPGFSPPLAMVTGNDRTAWVVITAILGLIYSLLFELVRIFVSWTTGRGLLHSDDVALGTSTVS
jgi:hypothetical protein